MDDPVALDCAFCGATALVIPASNYGPALVQCSNPNCRVRPSVEGNIDLAETLADVITIWNIRK